MVTVAAVPEPMLDKITPAILAAIDGAIDILRLVAADIVPGADLAAEDFDKKYLPALLAVAGLSTLSGRSDRPRSVEGVSYCCVCGEAHERRSVWCSERCRRRDRRVLHQFFVHVASSCAHCGGPMAARRSNKKFCSEKCRNQHWHGKR